MPTQVEIVNEALVNCMQPVIQSFTENSVSAEQAAYWYPIWRRRLLAAYDWPFATLTSVLALHAEDPPADWGYRYGLPGDAKWIRRVLTDGTTRVAPLIPFRVELLADKSAKTLLTDANPAYLRYTYDCDNAALFDEYFAGALAARLSAQFALAMNKDRLLYGEFVAQAGAALAEARLHVRLEEYDEVEEHPAETARR